MPYSFMCAKHDCDLMVNEAAHCGLVQDEVDPNMWDWDLSGFMCPQADPEDPCDEDWEVLRVRKEMPSE